MDQVREAGTRRRSQAETTISTGPEQFAESSSDERSAPEKTSRDPYLSPGTRRVLLAALLFGSFGAGWYVLYFVADPTTRMILGMGVLLSVMWTSSYVGIIDRMAEAIDERRRLRRYPKLRSRVVQMLDEIKRMHWLVVDMDRGFRDEDGGRVEMALIQRRLNELVAGLPEVAGVEGPISGKGDA